MRKRLLTALLIACVALPPNFCLANVSYAASYFSIYQRAKGIEVYTSRVGDLMVFVNLKEGASVRILNGDVTGNYGSGMFGGRSSTFARLPIQTYWQKCSGCLFVFNGSVFAARTSNGPGGSKAMHYPEKVNGQVLTEGKGEGVNFSLLQLWPDHADIAYIEPGKSESMAIAREILYGIVPEVDFIKAAILRANGISQKAVPAPTVLGGVMQRAKKDRVARTFLFVLDRDKDSVYETVALCRTRDAVAEDVYTERVTPFLQQQGNYRLLVLDGGSLSQVVSRWGELNALTRCELNRDSYGNPAPDYSCYPPQALAVYPAP